MNRQEGIGFLGNDVRITSVGDDRFVLQFRVAIKSKINRRGVTEEHTEWFDVKAYCSARAAQIHRERGLKGAMVYFSGATYTEEYKDQDQVMRYRRLVMCDSSRDIEYLKEPKSARRPEAQAPRYEPRGGLPPRMDDDLPQSYGDIPFDDDEAPRSRASHSSGPAPRAPVSTPASQDPLVRSHRDLMDFDR